MSDERTVGRADPHEEHRYVVEVIVPAAVEQAVLKPIANAEDAIIFMEDLIQRALPDPRFRIRVLKRTVHVPPPAQLLTGVQSMIDQVSHGNRREDFSRLLYLTRTMRLQKKRMDQRQREQAERLHQTVRKMIGL